MIPVAVVVAVILLALAVPIFLVFGIGSASIALFQLHLPWSTLIQVSFGTLTKQVLLAIPLFIFAGTIMLKGGAARRLVDFSIALVGHLPGGLGIAMVVTMGFFGSFCGSILAAISAVGTVLMPKMIEHGYPRPFVVVLAAAAALLESLIPPSNAAIIYSSLTEVPISQTFAAGIIPGFVLVGLLTLYVVWVCRGMKRTARASAGVVWRSFVSSFPALLTPVIIMGGIYGGFLTPTETAAAAALWGIVIGVVAYRELTFKGLIEALRQTAETTTIIFAIIAMATFMSVILTYTRAPQNLIDYVIHFKVDALSFMILAGLAVLILGTFLEVVPIAYLTLPVFIPICLALKVDLLQFYVFLTGLIGLGLLTPPVCVGVYTSAAVIGEPPARVFRAVPGFVFIGLVYAAIMVMFPGLASWLPRNL